MTMIDSQTICPSNNYDSSLPEDGIPVVVLSHEDSIQELDVVETDSVQESSDVCGAITVSKVDCVAVQPLILHSAEQILNRPAFSSATVTKRTEDDLLGMGLRKVYGVLQVSSIRPDCLLSKAPFQVGDKVVSINNIDCTQKSLNSVAAMLKKTIGLLTVVVEHSEGDPKLVESMILKETPTSKTGLGVNGSSRVFVSSVHPKSPFSGSLLSTRDHILSINGRDCTFLQAKAAAALITNAPSAVTIIAKKGMDNAAVVAFAASA